MKKNLRQAWQLLRDSLLFFYQGLQQNLFKEHLKSYFTNISFHLGKFHFQLQRMKSQSIQNNLSGHHQIKGLHALLPESKKFSYSILIELTNSSPKALKSCLSSTCLQTAPSFEVLIGSRAPVHPKSLTIIRELQKVYSNIKLFDFTNAKQIPFYNQLAKEACGNFLLFVTEGDWIRHDLLYRYEQFLRTLPNTENAILSCLKNKINEKDCLIPGSLFPKQQLHFPFIFQGGCNLEGVLLAKSLWNHVEGITEKSIGAEADDLFFRLDLANACFTEIPFCLYFCRQRPSQRSLDTTAFIQVLKNYAAKKNLEWTFETGYLLDAVRCIPQSLKKHKIHVVIPFKDQKELTLKCLDSVLAQKDVDFIITAIDNGSKDPSIGNAIRLKGGEVMHVDEPFNYSRLNNHAVTNTQAGQDCDLILFLNNDVELDPNALHEMSLWIDQPSIGMVGARLHYPNGQLQHGGLMLNAHHLPEHLWWDHREKYLPYELMKETKVHGLVDAVTAACALIKKETFLKIDGFDEIWYPISYSDTHLAFKLNKIGLKCFYTPYAFGTHHESLTRKEALDDVEGSRWLHQLVHQ